MAKAVSSMNETMLDTAKRAVETALRSLRGRARYGHLADDLRQEAMMAIHKALMSNAVNAETAFAYFYRISRNAMLYFLSRKELPRRRYFGNSKNKQSRTAVYSFDSQPRGSEECAVNNLFVDVSYDERSRIDNALDMERVISVLPARYRDLFHKILMGYTLSEYARMCGTSYENIRQKYHAAVEYIRRNFQQTANEL